MTQVFQEKQLQFHFPDELFVDVLDKQGVQLPVGMALVDFVIMEEHQTFLVEIKDPSNSRAQAKERAKYIKRLQNDSLITEELTPKARDSYTFLHLMEKDSKPFVYVVLVGLDAYRNEEALLLGFKDRLLKRIFCETELPWKRKYIQDCIVVSIEQWNKRFQNWSVSRLTN